MLTESVSFKAKLERRNRILIPRLCRWRYKMEPGEVLEVNVELFGSGFEEEFLGKMSCDGRLTVPKLTLEVLEEKEGKKLAGCILEVRISPAGRLDDVPPSK